MIESNKPSDSQPITISLQLKLLLCGIFLGYGLAFAAWWFVCPKGFPLEHPRFWANSIIPLFVIACCLISIYGAIKQNGGILKTAMSAFSIATLAAVITSKVLYPISMQPVLLVFGLGWALIMSLFTLLTYLSLPRQHTSLLGLTGGLFIYAAIGIFLPWSQKGLPAQTAPLDIVFPAAELRSKRVPQTPFALSDIIKTTSDYKGLVLQCNETQIEIRPLLTFISRSPDRFWILFAPRSERIGPKRILTGMQLGTDKLSFGYKDDGESFLEMIPSEDRRSVEIQSYCHLPQEVYSHLNSYTQLVVHGQKKLSIAFSPCIENRIEITAYDYPFGRPAKMSFLSEDGVFHIVQATNAEKGPFRTLAQGPLNKEDPIAFTIYEDDKPICHVQLNDWAKQASTQLSPTAGWGLPENTISFNLIEENPPVAFIHIALADTSVGRGFDSVGHDPGVYRNHMIIENLTTASIE